MYRVVSTVVALTLLLSAGCNQDRPREKARQSAQKVKDDPGDATPQKGDPKPEPKPKPEPPKESPKLLAFKKKGRVLSCCTRPCLL